MTYLRHAILLTGAALIASPALAQQATPAPQATPQTTAPAAVTDAEVQMFAKAALAADRIAKDAAIPAADKQKHMADAVTQSGLEPLRFNQIAQASQSDPTLQQKVQTAIVAQQQAQPAPAPAAPSSPTPAATPGQTQ